MKLDYFLPLVPRDARILDVGCADGWFGSSAEARGYTNVVGIDIEPPADVIGDIRDWRAHGLEAHSFDAIVAFEVIEHGDFARAFWELLRPGGLLFITTPVPHLDGCCESLERVGLLQSRGSPHTNLTDLRELREFDVESYRVKALLSQWGVLRARERHRIPAEQPSIGERSAAVRWLQQRQERRARPIDASIYDTEYLLSPVLEGLPEYLDGSLSILRRRELELLDLRSGDRVLDLGCGRGEASAEMARRGAEVVSIDYSWDAARLTKSYLGRSTPTTRCLQADGTALPFASGSFDRVLMGDVIEHLPWHLAIETLVEVQRVLAPSGRLIIHTSPNTWFIYCVKPVVVALMRALGRTEVVARFSEYDRLRHAMHPNELSPLKLPRLLRAAGLTGRTWVDRDVLRSGQSEWTAGISGGVMGRTVARAAGALPLRLVLGNDLYAVVPVSDQR
jgi:2-polyprenyl-3-methyl-5-hydroxy-6-metoxy-1,4-benzoquinol methylase